MRRDGSGPRSLTDDALPSWFPAWAPNGRWILFLHGDPLQIYKMRRDGSEVTQVTTDEEDHYGPDWQPLPQGPESLRRAATADLFSVLGGASLNQPQADDSKGCETSLKGKISR